MAIYPHPVLRNDTDDIEGDLIFNTPEIGSNELIIRQVKIKNDEFKRLLSDGTFSYFLEIENPSSFFNKGILQSKSDFQLFLDPAEYPEGKYSIQLSVISNKNINNYHLNSFHKDFGKTEFDISKGDTVAFFGAYQITLNKNFGSLNEPESFFKWEDTNDPNLTGRCQVYPSGDKIVILIHEDDKINRLLLMKGLNIEYLTLAYIIPALIQAINLIQKDQELSNEKQEVPQFDDAAWALKIAELCDKYSLDINDPAVLTAHVLAQDPIIGSSDYLMDLATSGGLIQDED